MKNVSIEVQYRAKQSGREEVNLKITSDDPHDVTALEHIKENIKALSELQHGMDGKALVITCGAPFDHHSCFEEILLTVCKGISFSAKFVDLDCINQQATSKRMRKH